MITLKFYIFFSLILSPISFRYFDGIYWFQLKYAKIIRFKFASFLIFYSSEIAKKSQLMHDFEWMMMSWWNGGERHQQFRMNLNLKVVIKRRMEVALLRNAIRWSEQTTHKINSTRWTDQCCEFENIIPHFSLINHVSGEFVGSFLFSGSETHKTQTTITKNEWKVVCQPRNVNWK